ncbi:MAG: CRISPR-associated helicase Cas3' [Candidatus Omnitrophica bacterium]|nr:CRISPR-associated helicase Cas3' [Candidatus Omnitrophota bacterium]
MSIADILRAKSKGEENYLLKDHLKETILRAIQLRNFINNNRFAFNNKFDDTFFKNLITACFLHDLGKINWNFQKNLFDKTEREYDKENRRYKNEEFNQLYEFFKKLWHIDVKDHEVISLIYSLIFLDNDEWDKKIRTTVLLHHYNEFYTNRDSANIRYVFDDYPDLKKYVEFLIDSKGNISALLTDLLNNNLLNNIEDEFTKNVLENLKNKINFWKIEEFNECISKGYGLSAKLKLFNIPDIEDEAFYEFFVFLGCLRRCDYSASANIEIENIQNLSGVYENLDEKIRNKVGENEEIWQEKVLRNILEKNDSKNLVLIAPTGSGKTEFALLWTKNRNKKLIYTLPLRVALNDLYWRFSNGNDGYFENNYVRILHSTSFVEYLKEVREGKDLNVNMKQVTAELFSSPLILTTPDQVFLSSLKYYGFDKLISIYPFSAIVIDEIQAYNPEMAAVIIKTLEIIKSLLGDILVITATFPPYFEKFLNKDKGFEIIDLKNNNEKDQIKNYNLKRHKIELINQSIFEYKEAENKNPDFDINEGTLRKIKQIIEQNESENILIIFNNVLKAIKLYKKLEETDNGLKIKKENLYLLHSRLLEKEKDKRISEIKGKLLEKINNNARLILVATQIVEASVDIDFDILITEISTIDSQIQRWGRIYRNRENDYSINMPNIFIFTGIDKGTSAIYDKRIIKETIEVLKEYQNQLLNYEKEREIIEDVFNSKIEEQKLKDVFVEEIKKNLEWLKYYSAEKRTEAQRIFRQIAGIQVAIPQLMKKEKNKIAEYLAEIINDPENKNLPWETIIKKIKEKANEETNIWSLKKILYDYSTSIPMFYFEKMQGIISHEFREFFILKEISEDNIEKIIRYGIDGIKDDIDSKEIEEFSNII